MQVVLKLWIDLVHALVAKYGKPLPDEMLEIGNPGDGWFVKFNNTNSTVGDLQIGDARIEWNGFPAGFIKPNAGVIAAGELANQDTFSIWLKGCSSGNS